MWLFKMKWSLKMVVAYHIIYNSTCTCDSDRCVLLLTAYMPVWYNLIKYNWHDSYKLSIIAQAPMAIQMDSPNIGTTGLCCYNNISGSKIEGDSWTKKSYVLRQQCKYKFPQTAIPTSRRNIRHCLHIYSHPK